MSTTTAQPATTPIPVQLSESEFTAFIFPHLSMPKRGPKCKLGYHRVFNLILWVLYTGMQWKCLPVPTDPQGKPAIHSTTLYKSFVQWADDGSLWPKKGRWHRLLGVQTPEGGESHRHHGQQRLCEYHLKNSGLKAPALTDCHDKGKLA